MKKSFIGSAIAFLLATSCCWVPWLAIFLGGAASLTSFNNNLQQFSGGFILLGVAFLSYGLYQFYMRNNTKKVTLDSKITCPNCKHQKIEHMPVDACQFFYECEKCNKILKPKNGDCCVYCSYGTVACPPIQKGETCCL